MNISIDKKTGALLAIIALLTVALVGVTVKDRDKSRMSSSGHNHSSHSSGNYTGADVMFLQMMIPHHQQAIDISNLALKTSSNKELLALAKIIARDQATEIVQMKAWLKDAGATEDMGHEAHGMGGMLDDEELSALTAATGKEFDNLWLTGMTEHHDGAIHMVQMIEDADNQIIKKFGQDIVSLQTAQINQMKEMLKRIG